jgi:hypothetical protein
VYTDQATLATFAKAIGLVNSASSDAQALAAFRQADSATLLSKIQAVTTQSAPSTRAQQIVRDMNAMLQSGQEVASVLQDLASPDLNIQKAAKAKISAQYAKYKELQTAQAQLAGASLSIN